MLFVPLTTSRQPNSDGPQPTSDGLQPNSDDLQLFKHEEQDEPGLCSCNSLSFASVSGQWKVSDGTVAKPVRVADRFNLRNIKPVKQSEVKPLIVVASCS